ncbi:flagellar filament capping protein FliD [Paenibacillus sp. GYB003]|uniref:flagellar filament capping protein FliD n=1 Tax=Paenibacillus sp. GYB003 TaxID=2994392 RepID=UPI002F96B237
MDVSRLRLNGFSSGMDIDEMVKKLMSASRIPLDKLKQQKQIMEWQREDYREMNKLILDLRNSAMNMKLQNSYGAKRASYAGDAFTVTASSDATEGIYSFKVNNLAKAATVTSGDVVAGAGDANKKLSELGLSANSTLTISGAKGTATIVVKPDDTLDLLMRTVNAKSATTGVKLSYDATLDRLFFTTTATGASSSFNIKSSDPGLLDSVLKCTSSAGTVTANRITGTQAFTAITDKIDNTLTTEQTLRLTYDGTNYDYKINKDMSLEQLITTINGSEAGKAGISAYLDDNKKLAFILPDKTKTFSFSDETSDSSDIVAKLGLSAPDAADVVYEELSAVGTDANVTFNNVTGSFSSNTFTINGMTFTLKEATGTTEDITVTNDTDGVFESIKGFMDKYNDSIDKINKKLTEERYRDYTPLTDEQKEAMSDKDIERWEERAKSGLIRRDQTLEGALNQLRTAFSSVVTGLSSGDISQLSQIGISTLDYSERGKLHIDEAKLKKALADNPDQVMKLFTADDNNKDSRSGDGVANRIYQIADSFYKQIVEKAGSVSTTVLDAYTIGKNIKDLDKRIDSLSTRLIGLEEQYYKQFTAMETALSRMNAQSSYLAQQFGGAQ